MVINKRQAKPGAGPGAAAAAGSAEGRGDIAIWRLSSAFLLPPAFPKKPAGKGSGETETSQAGRFAVPFTANNEQQRN